MRPEKVKISGRKSKYCIQVEKCFFQGKEYKIKGKKDNEMAILFRKPIEINKKYMLNS